MHLNRSKRGKDAVSPATTPRLKLMLLLTLAMLAAIAPFATDMYLPAFPLMARGLMTTATGVQMSLTAFLVGAAIGQLLFGPLSDRYGRVPPVLAGTLVCAGAGAAAALSPNIHVLVAARFVQGFAGSAGMVVGRAIISDLAEDKVQAARGFSLLQTVLGVAPIIAPWLGSVLVGPLGWRGTLWVICGTTIVSLGGVLAFVHETHPPERRTLPGGGGRGFATLLAPQFMGNALAFSLAFAAMMAYISASPFFFQVVMGLSVIQYGLVFALVALVLSAVGMLSAHLAARVPARRQVRLGLLLLLSGSLVLAGIVALELPVVWTLLPILVAVGSLGFVLGGATTSALAAVPGATGTGSAVLGALSFGLGALAVPLVGLRGEQCAGPMALVMVVAATLALAAFLFADWGMRRTPDLEDDPEEGCACDAE